MPVVEINTSCNPVWVTIPDGAVETLAATYAAGAAAVDQTMLINAADGGPVIFQANAAATGSLVQAQTSTGTVLFNITDNAAITIAPTTALTLTAAAASTWSTTAGALTITSAAAATWSTSAGALTLQGTTLVTLKSADADGASAVAASIDTTSAWSNASAKLLSVRNNAAEKWFLTTDGYFKSPTNGALKMLSPNGSGQLFIDDATVGTRLGYSSNILTITGSQYTLETATHFVKLNDGTLFPDDLGVVLGDATHRWNGAFSKWYCTIVGAQLTAANTITPTAGIHHVTGATVIKTIATTNVPGDGATFTLIADTSTVNWDATGNIAVAGVVTTALRTIIFTWDATAVKWYPSAVA